MLHSSACETTKPKAFEQAQWLMRRWWCSLCRSYSLARANEGSVSRKQNTNSSVKQQKRSTTNKNKNKNKNKNNNNYNHNHNHNHNDDNDNDTATTTESWSLLEQWLACQKWYGWLTTHIYIKSLELCEPKEDDTKLGRAGRMHSMLQSTCVQFWQANLTSDWRTEASMSPLNLRRGPPLGIFVAMAQVAPVVAPIFEMPWNGNTLQSLRWA